MLRKITQEIEEYMSQETEIADGVKFSAYKTIRRIGLFKNHYYPTGKFDSQDNMKY